MKKVPNNLTKPEELKKKLQNNAYHSNLMDWGRSQAKSHVFNRGSRSKSSRQNSNPNYSQKNMHSMSKENLVPNNPINKTNSLPKKSYNSLSKSYLDEKIRKKQGTLQKKRSQSQNSKLFQSHSYLGYQSNKSYDLHQDRKEKPQYVSCKKLKEGKSLTKDINKGKSKKIQQTTRLARQLASKLGDKKNIKFGYRTKKGILASNPKKMNQDRYLIEKIDVFAGLCKQQVQQNLFVVADGHGVQGHDVSQKIVKSYPKIAAEAFAKKQTPEDAFYGIYNSLQKQLEDEGSGVNATCSGSTLVSVLIEDNYITCANVGDSRAILARQVDRKNWELIYLSQDQKPSIQSQKNRILKCGGRVHCLRDQNGNPVGPMRAWLPNKNIQGLAMSRSMGDNVSKPYGVIHRPELIKIPTDKRDKFILIASDGVWQFISNQQVLKLIVPYYRENKLEQACDALLKLAYESWTVEDNTVVDDITFILIFF